MRRIRREPPRKPDGSVMRPEDVKESPVRERFSLFSRHAADVAGGPWSFTVAFLVVATWALTGPIFGFSDTWQLVINTGTTIVTFLMVFLIQNSQNKDTQVLQLKLDELLASHAGASNRLIGLEDLSEAEVKRLQVRFQLLASALEAEGTRRSRAPTSIEDEEKEERRAARNGRRSRPT